MSFSLDALNLIQITSRIYSYLNLHFSHIALDIKLNKQCLRPLNLPTCRLLATKTGEKSVSS